MKSNKSYLSHLSHIIKENREDMPVIIPFLSRTLFDSAQAEGRLTCESEIHQTAKFKLRPFYKNISVSFQ